MLKFLSEDETGKLYTVQCECGRELLVTKNVLKNKGDKMLCGLCRPDKEDLTGRVFDKLTVLERLINTPGGQPQWLCQCECGNKVNITTTSLLSSRHHSCGCDLKPQTPSPFKNPLYGRYSGMIRRCTNPADSNYHRDFQHMHNSTHCKSKGLAIFSWHAPI